ncbi:MAG TPA: class I SAM-dependent methyltransferase [Candidatus Limnocylindrales bacterium]|nr:class I SAM-dependent methyltransferase [Candidatus Limnocylindrales bacterium]
MAEFDAYAENYAEALGRGLAISGEDSSYYLRGRVAWLKGCLQRMGFKPGSCLDYGCGCGDSAPELVSALGVQTVTGVDVSSSQIEIARRKHARANCSFATVNEPPPAGAFDLAYSNGVFHHIPPVERPAALQYINKALKPGAYFALWENNPWNPGTRYVMKRIPFDKDAITLSPLETRRLVTAAGLKVISITFLFLFPRALRVFRPLEPRVARLPLGAQYQVLCRKT